MRVVDLVPEEHFTEGEPDLEPPEELAVGELDDETILEEEIDNDDVSEEDVDDDLLTATLEHLSHSGDREEDEDDDDEKDDVAVSFAPAEQLEAMEMLDVDEIEDLEESLDLVLAQRLAMDGNGHEPDEAEERGVPRLRFAAMGAGCTPEEFVCRGCFLVRNRAQLADPTSGFCRDCVS